MPSLQDQDMEPCICEECGEPYGIDLTMLKLNIDFELITLGEMTDHSLSVTHDAYAEDALNLIQRFCGKCGPAKLIAYKVACTAGKNCNHPDCQIKGHKE